MSYATTIVSLSALTLNSAALAWGEEAPKANFRSSETLLDASIANSADDQLADIEDLIVDIRNGQVAYAVISTNGFMGLPNREIAVPYGALSWKPDATQFSIHATADQLRSLPEFSKADLRLLDDESWFSTLRSIFGEMKEFESLAESKNHDEYSWLFKQGDQQTIKGSVMAVHEQARTARGSTMYAVVIDSEDADEPATVLLAPIAYLTSKKQVPTQGNEISVTTVKSYDWEGNLVHVAKSYAIDGDTIRVRDDHGAPSWSTPMAATASAAATPNHIMASELDDGDVYTQGKKWGDVTDVVFEAHSGKAAFAIVSVGGVLGVDDTLYPLPCGIFQVGRGQNLYTNWPESRLTTAPKLSEQGVDDLSNQTFSKSVYDYYKMTPKKYDTDRAASWKAAAGAARGSKPRSR